MGVSDELALQGRLFQTDSAAKKKKKKNSDPVCAWSQMIIVKYPEPQLRPTPFSNRRWETRPPCACWPGQGRPVSCAEHVMTLAHKVCTGWRGFPRSNYVLGLHGRWLPACWGHPSGGQGTVNTLPCCWQPEKATCRAIYVKHNA